MFRSAKESTPSTPASSKGQSRKSRAPAASEPESSENEGTTSSTTASLSHAPSVTRSSSHHHSPSELLEKSDRISKEKQKFFRLSAIFADKKRAADKKKAEAAKNAALEEKKLLNKPTNKPVNSDVNKNRIETVDAGKRVSTTRSRTEPLEVSESSKVVKKRECESKCNTRTNKIKSNNKLDVKNKEKKTKPVPSPVKVSTPVTKNKIISKALASKVKRVEKKPVVVKHEESSSASSSEEEPPKEPHPADSESSMDTSEECSTSSSDESTSMDSDSDTSAHRSENSRMSLTGPKLKPSSSLFVSTKNTTMSTFGSISGINDSKDSKVWGFAAAAAEANKSNNFANKESFGSFSSNFIKNESKSSDSFSMLADDKTSTSTSTSNSSYDKLKPGLGQLRGLFDGLSHLFTTNESRSRTSTTPNYNPTRRKRTSEKPLEKEKEPTKKTLTEPKEEKRPKIEPKEKENNNVKKASVISTTTNTNMSSSTSASTSTNTSASTSTTTSASTSTSNSTSTSTIIPKPESAVGIASVLAKQTNITIPPKIPRRITPHTISTQVERKPPRPAIFPPTSEDHKPWMQMTPSNLVKTAVNSKRHELERRNFLKGEVPFGGLGYMGFSHSSLLEDVRMKKRNLIAEATQTNHPLSVPQPSNNQPGKMGHRTHPTKPVCPIPCPLPNIPLVTPQVSSFYLFYILSHARRDLKDLLCTLSVF